MPAGPGELWLQAPDAGVGAQSLHETVLAAMRCLGDGGAGGRAEPLPRDPPTSACTPGVSQPHATLASAAQSSGLSHGGGLREKGGKAAPQPSAPRTWNAAGSDYEPMGGGETSGYMVTVPPGLTAAPHKPLQSCRGTEFIPMSRFPPGPLSLSALPGFY